MSLYVRYQPIALGGAGGGGVTTMGPFGSSPNANGGTITGSTLTLQPADGTNPGGVSVTTQTFGGDKTFLGTISASNLSGTNTGDVTIGTANGLSLAGQVLSLALSSTSTTGALSSTDWNTFNGKQPAGNYITALTGDVTATGPGSAAATVAKIQGTTVSGTTGSGNVVFSASPTLTGTITAAAATFSGTINADGGIDRSTVGTLTIGATNSNVINIGNSGATVNIQGTTIYENTPQLLTSDPLITVNHGGGAGSGQNAGIQVEEASSITGYAETSADRNSWILKAPNTAGIATITPGSSGITLNQSSHDPVTIGTANGLSLSTQVLSLALSSTSTTGALSSTDWNTFNNKQPAGTYVTSISIASANGFAGSSSGGATPTLTLTTSITGILQGNGTAISAASTTGSGAVVLATSPTLVTPALGTPSAIVLTSGTGLPLTTGVTGTLPIGNGGTGATTKAAAFDALSPMTTGGDIVYGGASGTGTRLANGSSGQVLTSSGGTTAPTWTSVGSSLTVTTITNASSPYTVLSTDQYILANATSGAITVNLPAASTLSGRTIRFQKTDSSTNLITVTRAGSDTIEGTTTFTLATQYESLTLISDGSATWYIQDHSYPLGQVSTTLTPSGAWGTSTAGSYFMSRQGNMANFYGYFKGGTVAAASQSIALPTGIVIDTNFYNATATRLFGYGSRVRTGGAGGTDLYWVFFDGSATNTVFVGTQSASDIFQKQNGSTGFATGDGFAFNFSVAVVGWRG